MRYRSCFRSCISVRSNPKETLTGTIFPCLRTLSIVLPNSDPVLISFRRRSPADKWVMPYSFENFSHCVPFPLPGPLWSISDINHGWSVSRLLRKLPPRTNIAFALLLEDWTCLSAWDDDWTYRATFNAYCLIVAVFWSCRKETDASMLMKNTIAAKFPPAARNKCMKKSEKIQSGDDFLSQPVTKIANQIV